MDDRPMAAELLADNLPCIDEEVSDAQLAAIGDRIRQAIQEDAHRQFKSLAGVTFTDQQFSNLLGEVETLVIFQCAKSRIREKVAFMIVREIEAVLHSILDTTRDKVIPNNGLKVTS